MKKIVVILGAGTHDGIGGALARRFAQKGLHIVITGRTQAKLLKIENSIESEDCSIETREVDVTSESDQNELFNHLQRLGEITAVLYNAGNNALIPFEDLSSTQFEDFWRVNCLGGFLTAQRAMPLLRAQGHGSIIFTGASGSLRGKANFAHFASSKGALRNLAQSLAREYGPHGVHVAHVIIDGLVDGDTAKSRFPEYLESLGNKGALSPDAIADAYWFIHSQTRTAWTHELDLRPFKETW